MFISSLSFLDRNKLKFACPEERLSREKNTRKYPDKVANFLFKNFKLHFDDIDYFVSSYNPGILFNKFNPIISSQRRHFSEHLISFPDNILKLKDNRSEMMGEFTKQEILHKNKKINFYFVNHHSAHVANSFYSSNFKKSICIVADLQGEIASFTTWKCKENNFTKIEEVEYPNSLGILYTTVTEFLGFKPNSDEWRVMALSSYYLNQKNKFYSKLKNNIIKIGKNGSFEIDYSFFNGYFPLKPNLYSKKFIKYFGNPRKKNDTITIRHKLIAQAFQKVLEEIIFLKVSYLSKKFKEKNFCFSGGIFMNCLMNGKIEQKFKNLNFFIPFAPDDSGNSIGAALFLKKNILKHKGKISNLNTSFLGPEYLNNQIEKELNLSKIKYKKLKDVCNHAAINLKQNKIIGWFQGKMEFGQRSLGNRSILANPLDKNMKSKLNKSVKFRESFRPFAPTILYEYFNKFFENKRKDYSSPYMEKVYYIKEKYRKTLPAITHVDSSSRVQTLKKDQNIKFYSLIEEFKELTNIPILINTSLNINGEPTVCSPKDAIRTFYMSGIECMYLNDYYIEK